MTDFDEFWKHYPNKKGKGYARKCFEKQLKAKILPNTSELITAINSQIRERKHLKGQNRFVAPWKNPSTWLNQECWSDECFTPFAAKKKPTNPNFLLTESYYRLEKYGRASFLSYARKNNMTSDDIAGVEGKYERDQQGMSVDHIVGRIDDRRNRQ